MSRKLALTPARLAANRANARKSTGPRTARGKAASSRNATKHGLLSRELLLKNDPAETESAYRSLLNGFTACFQPQGPDETMLVERIAICYWRLARIARFEARAIDHPSAGNTAGPTRPILPDPVNLEAVVRYETLIDRQLHRAMRSFQCLRNYRQAAGPQIKKDTTNPSQTPFLAPTAPMQPQNT